MTIKQDAYNSYFNTRHDQEQLANRFDEAFNINFGKDHGQLAFWLSAETCPLNFYPKFRIWSDWGGFLKCEPE